MFYKIVPASSLSYYMGKDECVSTEARYSSAGTVLLRFDRKVSSSYKTLDDIMIDLQDAEWQSNDPER